MFGEFGLVLQERTIPSVWPGTREASMSFETQQRTASTSSHSSEASMFNGDALFGSEIECTKMSALTQAVSAQLLPMVAWIRKLTAEKRLQRNEDGRD